MKAVAVIEEKKIGGKTSSKGPPKAPGGKAQKLKGRGVKPKSRGTTTLTPGVSKVGASLLPTGDPVKQAIIKRVMRMLEDTLRDATQANLQQAVEAPTDAGSAAYLISMAATMDEAVRELDPTAAAIVRGAEMKRDLLKRAGGVLDTARVAERLGISRQAVAKRVRSNTLLAIPDASGHLQFPAIQFTDTGTVDGIEKVFAAFNVDSPWTRLAVLLDTDGAVGGKRLIDALRSGEVQGVLDVVRSFGA